MFFDKKTVLKICLNLELNLTIFRGTEATTFNLDVKDDDLIDMMPPCKFFINFFLYRFLYHRLLLTFHSVTSFLLCFEKREVNSIYIKGQFIFRRSRMQ